MQRSSEVSSPLIYHRYLPYVSKADFGLANIGVVQAPTNMITADIYAWKAPHLSELGSLVMARR